MSAPRHAPRFTAEGLQARYDHATRHWQYFRFNSASGQYDQMTGSTQRYQHH